MAGLYIRLQQTFQKCTGCDGPCGSIAMKSYPSPKVRGGDGERQAVTAQEWPSYPTSEVRGGGPKELPRGQEELPNT